MDTAVEEADASPEVKMVAVPPPIQWQVVVPDQAPKGTVVLALVQGGWSAQLLLSGNDAITLASQLRSKGKQANCGLSIAKSTLLDASGNAIAVAADPDDEPEYENEATV